MKLEEKIGPFSAFVEFSFLNVSSVSCWDTPPPHQWYREAELDAHKTIFISQYEWGPLNPPVFSNSGYVHF